MQNNSTQTLNNIQMLRTIAALLVVFHHALPHYAAMGGKIMLIAFISEWGFFSSEDVVMPRIGLLIMISLAVIFSLAYYQKIEKPVYQKAIRDKRAL